MLGMLAHNIVSLQQQLINDVLKCKDINVDNIGQGTKLIGTRICSTKVLVVIDDSDHHEQFKSLVKPFASGSVVIISTRNEQILDTIEVEPRYRYMVKKLDDAESLTLFTQHAFGNAKPKNSLMALCKDVLRHAGGLLLALEVFDASLYKKPEVGWKYFIEKLQ
ncbi:disease resistance protein Roq1-like [Apium graveolens]|uniref:disease resistance protein Roq1-like n=1 Tax=Apium graveolens TaxID=4045 RepID=UPI003D78F4ED